VKKVAVVAIVLATAGTAAGLAIASMPLFSPPTQITLFGYVQTITPKGSGYLLRFDPALWLEGLTASDAAADDGQGTRGQPVPNDYYIRNPDHKLLSYKLPANAHVTVLVNLKTTKVTVAKLAQLLKTPQKNCGAPYMLRAPCRLGFWLRYQIDTVKALDQQFQP
jgi:hypothetical protein